MPRLQRNGEDEEVTRDTFRKLWVLMIGMLLLAANHTHGGLPELLEDMAEAETGALLLWEIFKDRL